MKLKGAKTTVISPALGLRLLRRQGTKYKPGDPGYDSIIHDIPKLPICASFVKHCHNYFFYYGGALFSASFSLAESCNFTDYQLEIEYEMGPGPIYEEESRILNRFDGVFRRYFYDYRTSAAAATKQEALVSRGAAHAW